MKKLIVPLLGALALSGCDSPGVKACETAIKATLKSPSSYKRISAEEYGSIKIEYDAVNSYNVPLRAHGTCFYDAATGKASWFNDTEMEERLKEAREAAERPYH